MAANAVASHGSLPGAVMQMRIDFILNSFQIVRKNLPRHIKRNPVFQTKHHIFHGAFHIMDNMYVKSFFQNQRKSQHIFLGKCNIFRHVFHRHVTAQIQRLHRPGQNGMFQKIQLSFTHFLQSVIMFRDRQLKWNFRDFETVKMNGSYIIIQIKFIHFFQKTGNIIVFFKLCKTQPVLNGLKTVFPDFQFFRRIPR